jgi:hypothetical protein
MPTVADVKPFRELLAGLRPDEPLRHGPLTVIPLTADPGPEPDWLTLDEAGEAAVIEEVSHGGDVPTLRVTNGTDRPLLLLDGEELVGAKQNRVLNTTVLVAKGARLDIPVSCVEQGRWSYTSRRFAPGDTSLYASVRARKAASVTRSLRLSKRHTSDQEDIWSGVHAKLSVAGVASDTGAMHDFFAARRDDLAAARAALAPRPGQVGALVWLGRKWLGLELLASPRLFARAWPRLCAGYAAEAVGRKGRPAAAPDASAVLRALAAAPVENAPAVGAGEEHRLTGRRLAGALLVVDHTVAHAMAFPAPPEAGGADNA